MSTFKPLMGDPVVTPPSRLQFISLKEADTGRQYSDNKYKITQLFEKGTDMKELAGAALKLAKEAWDDIETLDDLDLTPFKDGDEKSKWQGFEGCVYITSKSKTPVDCFAPDKTRINANEVYNGCLARACLAPFAYVSGRDRGVTFLLAFVQFLEDRPRFGGLGGINAEDVFGAYDGGEEEECAEQEAVEVEEEEEVEAEATTKAKPTQASGKKVKPTGKKKKTSNSDLLGMLNT